MITIEEIKKRAENDAKNNNYFLNYDHKFLVDLFSGLKTNEERYGYPSCPCRLASGEINYDRDIICPCDYRDIDVKDYGSCYCSLYISKDVFERKKNLKQIPERRPIEKQNRAYKEKDSVIKEKDIPAKILKEKNDVKLKLFYCKQCGYVTYREDPPYICPICKAKREMFSELPVKQQ